MAVVHENSLRAEIEQVEPTRCVGEAVAERAQSKSDVIQVYIIGQSSCGCSHGVFDVDANATIHRRRNLGCQQQRSLAPVLDDGDHLALPSLTQHHGTSLGADVFTDHRILFIHAEEDDLATGHTAHANGVLVIGIEHAHTVPKHAGHHNFFHSRELAERIHSLEPKVIGSNIGDHTDVAPIKTKTGTQNTAASCLQHRVVDRRVLQHHAGTGWTAHVAREDLLAIDVNTIGGREANRATTHLHDVSNHAGCGGFAVGTSDRHNRHTCVLTSREHHIHHGPAYVTWVPLGGIGVHTEAWASVHFHDGATVFAGGFGDVLGDEVNTSDIESHHHGSLPGDFDVIRVDIVGTIDGRTAGAHIACELELHELACFRNCFQCAVIAFEHFHGLAINRDTGEDLFVTNTTARILIGDFNQFLNIVLPITNDVRRYALRHSNNVVVHNKNAVVLAADIGLNEDRSAPGFSHC